MRLFLLIEVSFAVVIISFCSKHDDEDDEAIETTTLPEGNVSDSDLKIIGGLAAFILKYPFLASIQRIKGGHFCGGSILTKRWILTAAHCLCEKHNLIRRPPSYFKIVLGLTYCDEYEAVKARTYYVSAIYAHENYSRAPIRHDIGVMQLSSPIEYSDRVKPVMLAMPRQYDIPHNFFNECIVVGWGYTSEDGNKTNELQEVTLPLIYNQDCNNDLGFESIDDWQMCTLFPPGGKDACFGDSGGPIICNKTQVGVVSWGIGCGRIETPGVYSLIAPYIDWLNTTRFKNSSESILTSWLRPFICFIFNIVLLLIFCDIN